MLQYTKTIIDCFQSNRERLPSAPINLAVHVVSDDEVLISWESPRKNPHMVDGYRIYWREAESVIDDILQSKINGIGTYRADTKDMSLRISELRADVVYELVIKAGNQYGKIYTNIWLKALDVKANVYFRYHIGSSVLTEPIWFKLGDNHITTASNSNTAGTVCGILAGIVAIALAIAAIFLYQRRKSEKSANGVAFENPSYLREVNMEHVQVSVDISHSAPTPLIHVCRTSDIGSISTREQCKRMAFRAIAVQYNV